MMSVIASAVVDCCVETIAVCEMDVCCLTVKDVKKRIGGKFYSTDLLEEDPRMKTRLIRVPYMKLK